MSLKQKKATLLPQGPLAIIFFTPIVAIVLTSMLQRFDFSVQKNGWILCGLIILISICISIVCAKKARTNLEKIVSIIISWFGSAVVLFAFLFEEQTQVFNAAFIIGLIFSIIPLPILQIWQFRFKQ